MKQLFVMLVLFGFFAGVVSSCGSKKEENKGEQQQQEGEAYSDYETAEPAKADPTELIAQGQTLVDASDCKTCHHATNKIVGPAHADVAKKYEFTTANVSMLADKIQNGGSGNWGDIPMTPHTDLSRGDAEKMAMYVLSLDGEAYQE